MAFTCLAEPALVQVMEDAKAGGVKSQLELARRYSAQMDNVTAETWYKKAAESGDPEALTDLGQFYLGDRPDSKLRRSIPKDPANAVFLFSMAAYQGNKPAQRQLGTQLFYGNGCKKDLVQSYQMLALSEDMFAKIYLDKAILEMTPAQIEEGKRLVANFKPKPFNEVLSDMFLANLKLSGVIGKPGSEIVMINNKMFTTGQTAPINLREYKYLVKCESIKSNQVSISFNGRTNALTQGK
jgi:hypothetical protein